ncbi:MAG: AMP-binding protein [Xanthomonadales bacterium]|nr:AMP-binding protein [Xanthomonadales bacterium]
MNAHDAGAMPILRNAQALGAVVPNVGSLVLDNAARHAGAPAFAERVNGPYVHRSWQQFGADLLRFAAWLQAECASGSRVAFVAGNSYLRHVAELGTMAAGCVSVPVFAGYPAALMGELLQFSDVELLVTDQPDKVLALDPASLPRRLLLLAEPRQRDPAAYLASGGRIERIAEVLARDIDPTALAKVERDLRAVAEDSVCLIMYTSGTSGFPKGVQLTHRNLLSQQQALAQCWQPQPGLRMLCYLPWHHSFGGLFERFFAVAFGGCLALDDGCGKDVDRLLANFAEIRPHLFFSVPKIYQEIAARVQASAEVERAFFHPELKFVFTAAAPLPLSASEVFRAHGVPVVEGWGLTETSPCCTLTPFRLDRTPGVVGLPIPGVEVALAADGEILVRGANVMRGYFRNPEATRAAFTDDGWFRTGDIGEFGPEGVRICSRKERMFKLSNGEKVFPAQIEARIHARCQFVKYAYVFGSGQRTPHLLVFPNQQAFEGCGSGDGCVHPNDPAQLAHCLSNCMAEINARPAAGFETIRRALVVGRELSIEDNELTPSFKLIPKRIEERYADCIEAMEQGRYDQLPPDVFVLNLEASK